jgi:D-alanyl-lipoteichoic acid acyltransferase DltB (MBOAT superfamily)
MLFNSLEFGAFLVVVMVSCLCLPRRPQNRLLLFASYFFYGAWDARFLALILLSTAVDFAAGRGIEASDRAGRRRAWLLLSIAVNLGALGFFKYAGFFVDSFTALVAPLGVEPPDFMLQVVLPVGISFYTFQTLGYTIDVYRGVLRAERNLFDFALFVAFFPQLVAGPIERASSLLPQLRARPRAGAEAWATGIWLIVWGLFKKVVIADHVAPLVDAVYASGAQPVSAEVWVAGYAFALQIYCDFSGYTDIARGVASLLGVKLVYNFDLPYFSTSPSEFWRRWHISLSNWLRDYLYIPLGGNRRGPRRTALNLMLTMLLGGLWHGAAWNYVIWGGYHGALLAAERTWRRIRGGPGAPAGRLLKSLQVLATFHLMTLGWIIFRAEGGSGVRSILGQLFCEPGLGRVLEWLPTLGILAAPLLAMQLWQRRAGDPLVVLRAPLAIQALIYTCLLASILILGEDFGDPFIYFRF